MHETYHTDLPNIMHEIIEGEAVVVNLDNGTYYSFDGAGAQIWALLGDAGRSRSSLNTTIAARFAGEPEQISAALARFIAKLIDEGLIRVQTGDGEPAAAEQDAGATEATPAVPFVEPVLQKYTDMEALLLADPIHEVDDAGWPNLK